MPGTYLQHPIGALLLISEWNSKLLFLDTGLDLDNWFVELNSCACLDVQVWVLVNWRVWKDDCVIIHAGLVIIEIIVHDVVAKALLVHRCQFLKFVMTMR